MDSGNSGSMQSSSGGDEEYDSRAPESAFLNPSSNFGSLSNHNPASFLSHQQPTTTFFDPSSNYLQAFSQSHHPNSNSSSLLNLELVGPGSHLRSSESDKGNQQQGLNNHAPFASSSSMQAHRLVHDNNGGRYLAQPSNQSNNAVKNSKKRTRASRRAPTTVLTTDTSNFRAMVQEFTGIPAQPFSGSPYSRRLDLFGSGSAIKSGQMELPIGPLYPLRPTTHKFQPISISASTSNNNNTTTSSSFNSSVPCNNNNYHLVSDHLGLMTKDPHHHQNMLNNMQQQNPVLSFLQQPPLNPSSQLNVAAHAGNFGAKSHQASGFGLPSFEELAMGSGGGVNTSLGGLSSTGHHQDVQMMRPFDGNYNNNNNNSSQRVTSSCKLNYTAPSSDFHHHDKSLENVSSRAEGTVDSWICPSD
ncbi:hypothetical protein EZV62_021988 [Acer yangbiense]|uniref:VQ domain-containing protein n=1 Tax=Acer yangbiense TaxID=1000413 RepID=A0A5C7H7T9_9ROSI|nr:hypothetical protein EZV62_021988 [Acer yangbiense]